MISTTFLITSLIVVLVPGTGVLYTLATGLRLGRRASLYAALGCTAGIVPHLLACILGLAAVLHVCALAFQGLKLAGAAYLLYLAWTMWRDSGALALDQPPRETAPGSIAFRAFLMNILNPKLSIFFLAFLPQFIRPEAGPPMLQMLLLSTIFMAMTLATFIIYGLLAHQLRTIIQRSAHAQTWLRRSFALSFALLGFHLACSER